MISRARDSDRWRERGRPIFVCVKYWKAKRCTSCWSSSCLPVQLQCIVDIRVWENSIVKAWVNMKNVFFVFFIFTLPCLLLKLVKCLEWQIASRGVQTYKTIFKSIFSPSLILSYSMYPSSHTDACGGGGACENNKPVVGNLNFLKWTFWGYFWATSYQSIAFRPNRHRERERGEWWAGCCKCRSLNGCFTFHLIDNGGLQSYKAKIHQPRGIRCYTSS